MATQVRTTKLDRGNEVIIETITITSADASTNFKIDLPPGMYELAFIVYSAATMNTANSTVGGIAPYLDAAQTIVADTPFGIYDADDVYSSAVATTYTLANASTAAKYFVLNGLFGSVSTILGTAGEHGPFVLPYGLRVSFTKSGTPNAGSVTLVVVARRV